MNIIHNSSIGWQIDDDGLMVCENTLEEAIQSFAQGMFERGKIMVEKDTNEKSS